MPQKEGDEMPKPSDFFLSIVTFLGVLLPGAVLLFLRGAQLQRLHKELALPDIDAQWRWVVAAVAAYVAGQILLAVTDPLNGVASTVAAKMPYFFPSTGGISKSREAQDPRKATDEMRTVVAPKGQAPLPETADFHQALSYVRLRHLEAAAEVDRHMADYKLLRNLVLVFLIDAIWSLIDKAPVRAMWDGALMVLLFYGFVRMYCWAQIFAFQYKDLLPDTEKPAPAQK